MRRLMTHILCHKEFARLRQPMETDVEVLFFRIYRTVSVMPDSIQKTGDILCL